MTGSRLRAVDAARGLAACLVFIHHIDVFFPGALALLLGHDTFAQHVLKGLSGLNAEAVMLFFVISGFCIRATSLRYDFRRRSDVLDYARRRSARILPLYLIALSLTYGIGVVMGESANPTYSATTLLGNLLFLQSPASAAGTWFVPFGDNRPLWSISFEVFYYVLFPAAVLLEARCGAGLNDQRRRLAALAASFAFSWVALLLYQVIPNPILLFASLYCVWRVGVTAEDLREGEGRIVPTIAVLVGAVLIMSILVLTHGSDTLWMAIEGTVLGAVWMVLQARRMPARLLEMQPLQAISKLLAALGGISYGLYLIHYPMLRLAVYLFTDSRIGLLLGIVASLLLAWVTEKAGDWVKRLLLAANGQRTILAVGVDTPRLPR